MFLARMTPHALRSRNRPGITRFIAGRPHAPARRSRSPRAWRPNRDANHPVRAMRHRVIGGKNETTPATADGTSSQAVVSGERRGEVREQGEPLPSVWLASGPSGTKWLAGLQCECSESHDTHMCDRARLAEPGETRRFRSRRKSSRLRPRHHDRIVGFFPFEKGFSPCPPWSPE